MSYRPFDQNFANFDDVEQKLWRRKWWWCIGVALRGDDKKVAHLLLFQLGNLWLCLGDLPVDLGDLLQEVVLGAPHVVPLRRPVVRGRADGLHLGVVAGLLEEKTRFSFSDLNGLENDPSLSEHTVISNPANNTKVMYQYPSVCV